MKRKRLTMQELHAMDQLYEKKLTKEKIFKLSFTPSLICFLITFMLYYNVIVSCLFAILGGIFGYVYLIEKVVSYNYQLASFEERNFLLVTLTQLLVNKEKPIIIAIRTAKERCSGELKSDLQLVERRLLKGERNGVAEIFNMLREKYKSDSIFTQYLEQLETCIDEGRINIDTLKNITNQHNKIKEEQRDYIRQKKKRKDLLLVICLLALSIILIMSLGVGLTTVYIPFFSRKPFGIFICSIFLINFLLVGYNFLKHYLDFNVTKI